MLPVVLSGAHLPEKWPASIGQAKVINSVILLPAHPAFFTRNFVSGMQSFYFSESQDAMILQTCHEK